MKKFIALVFVLSSIVLGSYIGIGLLFVKPILVACSAFALGTLSIPLILITLLKCCLSVIVGGAVFWVLFCIGQVFLLFDNEDF